MAPLNDYESVFKIDLEFHSDVTEMDDDVLSTSLA